MKESRRKASTKFEVEPKVAIVKSTRPFSQNSDFKSSIQM